MHMLEMCRKPAQSIIYYVTNIPCTFDSDNLNYLTKCDSLLKICINQTKHNFSESISSFNIIEVVESQP